jgi:hypothetical protein
VDFFTFPYQSYQVDFMAAGLVVACTIILIFTTAGGSMFNLLLTGTADRVAPGEGGCYARAAVERDGMGCGEAASERNSCAGWGRHQVRETVA